MNAVTKFISGLNDNQKKLLIIAVIVVIAALFDRLLIGPTMSRLSSIEDDITKEETQIKQDTRFLDYKDRITQESREIDPYITKNMATDDEMIASFLRKVEDLAASNKISLAKINPMSGEQDAQYWKYQLDLDCSGNLADVIAFMHAVNADSSLMKVDKFNLVGKKTDTDEIKATMTVEKIVVPDKPMPPKATDASSPATPAT